MGHRTKELAALSRGRGSTSSCFVFRTEHSGEGWWETHPFPRSEYVLRHLFKIYLLLADFLSVSYLGHLSEFYIRWEALCCAELALCSADALEICQTVFQLINASTAAIERKLIVTNYDRLFSTVSFTTPTKWPLQTIRMCRDPMPMTPSLPGCFRRDSTTAITRYSTCTMKIASLLSANNCIGGNTNATDGCLLATVLHPVLLSS